MEPQEYKLLLECYHIPGRSAVLSVCEPTFRSDKSPPSSGVEDRPSKKPARSRWLGRILKVEAIRSSEASFNARTARSYIAENGNIRNYYCENIRSYKPPLLACRCTGSQYESLANVGSSTSLSFSR
jgi:hypothetical protein